MARKTKENQREKLNAGFAGEKGGVNSQWLVIGIKYFNCTASIKDNLHVLSGSCTPYCPKVVLHVVRQLYFVLSDSCTSCCPTVVL
jgi:hypothetical protein